MPKPLKMKTSTAGRDLIKQYEDLRLKGYLCPAGYPTWGWGHTGPDVRLGGSISLVRAEYLFEIDVSEAERVVASAVKIDLTQGQFDALVSFAFNVGPGVKGVKDGLVTLKSGRPSTLLAKINAGDFAGASAQFDLWVMSKGQKLNGLVARRAKERALFDGKA